MMYNPVSNYKLFSEYSFAALFPCWRQNEQLARETERENNFKILLLNVKYISFIILY